MTKYNISSRQLAILSAVIEEFLNSEELEMIPSALIVKQYDIDVCPATVRTEMAKLEREGFLTKPHISAGRVPSDIGIKYYISQIMEEQHIPLTIQEKIKNSISNYTDNLNHLLYKTSEILSNLTDEPVVTSFENATIQKGIYKLHKYTELYSPNHLFEALAYIENTQQIMDKVRNSHDQIFVLVGDDFEQRDLSMYGMVGIKINGYKGKKGIISVFSSKRMNYSTIIPLVRFVGQLLSKKLQKWNW